MFVKNILADKRGNVVTIEPTADLAAAAKLLAERRIGAVIILGADHRIVGILSERDIVRAVTEHGPTALNKPVSQLMTRDVKTCSEDDTIEAMGSMTAGKFRHMPVVQQGKLIGIVSIGDVVKSRVEIDHEAEALRDYIEPRKRVFRCGITVAVGDRPFPRDDNHKPKHHRTGLRMSVGSIASVSRYSPCGCFTPNTRHSSYTAYFNQARTHLALTNAPLGRAVQRFPY